MEFNSERATRLMESEQSSRSDSPQQTAKPCINNCGFFINPGTGSFCSICFDDWQERERQKTASITDVDNDAEEEDEKKKKIDRCWTCNRRLRLTMRFTCRCGESYCSTHRYPEDHDCKFDFKAFGRQSIARNNPIVRKDKIDRI